MVKQPGTGRLSAGAGDAKKSAEGSYSTKGEGGQPLHRRWSTGQGVSGAGQSGLGGPGDAGGGRPGQVPEVPPVNRCQGGAAMPPTTKQGDNRGDLRRSRESLWR